MAAQLVDAHLRLPRLFGKDMGMPSENKANTEEGRDPVSIPIHLCLRITSLS